MAGKATDLMKGAEPALHVAGMGFLFWAAFLLALDPDLVFGTAGGWLAAAGDDGPRIIAASVIGSGMAVVQHVLTARFPVAGAQRGLHLVIHLSACLALSPAAIAVANVGAPLVLAPDSHRLGTSIGEDIAANWLLLSFVLGAFAVLLHQLHRTQARASRATSRHDARIAVQARNGTLLVDAARVDWIEAQGNYAALHVGAETHLVRETLTRLAGRLDPESFVRVHRSVIVNLARLKRVRSLASGDAQIELADGTELRASRTFAGMLRDRLKD